MIIGLTGGIGSGKSTVANMFIELGIDAVDADVVAREVVDVGTPALNQIAEHFGDKVLDSNGSLNRTQLREIVFHSPEEKDWLNNLLHPIIREEMARQIAKCLSPYCLLIAPLLFENGLDKSVSRTLVIDVPEETQIARTLSRDESDEATIKNIINAQINREDRLAMADDVIDNSGDDLSSIKEQVRKLHQTYLALASYKI